MSDPIFVHLRLTLKSHMEFELLLQLQWKCHFASTIPFKRQYTEAKFTEQFMNANAFSSGKKRISIDFYENLPPILFLKPSMLAVMNFATVSTQTDRQTF